MGKEIFLDHDQSTMTPSLEEHLDEIYQVFGASSSEYDFLLFADAFDALHTLLFFIYVQVIRQTGRNHLLTTPVEETALLSVVSSLEPLGCVKKVLPLNAQGQVTKEILEETIRARTALVSLSWANGLTGIVHPAHDFAEVCREKETLLHIDVSASFGKHFFRLQDLGSDFLTFSCREATGLFLKKNVLGPLQKTISPFLLKNFHAAVQRIASDFLHVCTETARLKSQFEKKIQQACPEAHVLFEHVERLPDSTTIVFPGVHQEALLLSLQRKNIYASIGGLSSQKLSQLLAAHAIEPPLSLCALSFSLSAKTTQEEIDEAVQTIAQLVKKLQSYSHHIEGVS
jgi:cysteine desulfurase